MLKYLSKDELCKLSTCVIDVLGHLATLSVYYHGVKYTMYVFDRAEQIVYFNVWSQTYHALKNPTVRSK
jgi:hypothetical protein